MIARRTLFIVIGAIIIIAAIVVAAVVLLAPGPNSPAGISPVQPAVSGTGTGAEAKSGDSVSVYYTGMFTNGTIFDSDINGTPITFTVGSHQVIPGFENAIIGMKAGQSKTVNIPVDQAYGMYHPEYIHVINRTGTLVTMNLTKGSMLSYRNPSTNTMNTVKILAVTPETVTVDGNSPLAGQPLVFTIQLVSINQGTGSLPGKTP